MSNDYTKYTDYQVKLGKLNKNSDVLSASIISSIINTCYVTSSLNDVPMAENCTPGDLAIVSSIIGDNANTIARASYYCDGTAWQQINGDTLAEDIYFNNDLSIAEGSQINAKGKSIVNVLSAITEKLIEKTSRITIDNNSTPTDLSVHKLTYEQYNQLVVESAIVSNGLYIIEDDYVEGYGLQIKNVGAPTDLSDAATKEYVDNVDEKISKSFLPLSGGILSGDLTADSFYSNSYAEINGGEIFLGNSGLPGYTTLTKTGMFIDATQTELTYPISSGTLAIAASNATSNNIAALDAYGNPIDSNISKNSVESILFEKYYPDGTVTNSSEFRNDIKYTFYESNHTATAKAFCSTGAIENDNSNLSGRVVLPPFVDADGNPYVSNDGTRYTVVGINGVDGGAADINSNITSIIAPTTITDVGDSAFECCDSLALVSLPSVINLGYAVFYECSELTSISLPSAIAINDDTFCGCVALPSIALPSTQTIGMGVFIACNSLTSVSLPVANAIEDQAFAGCTELKTVKLPVIPSIGRSTFANCRSLLSIELPMATDIDYSAFMGCNSLTSALLPSITYIENQAFSGCSSLVVVTAPLVTDIGDYAFYNCDALTAISLPNATAIGDAAFYQCDALSSVVLPSISSIGDFAFYDCSALTSVDFGNTARASVPILGNAAFQNVLSTCKIIVPYTQYDAWTNADGWKDLPFTYVRHAEKADKPTSFTSGNIAVFDINGNPADANIGVTQVVTNSAYVGVTGTPPLIKNIQTVYETDWATLSASALSSTFYVVVPDPV